MANDDKDGDDKVVELRPGGKRKRLSSIDLLPKDVREALNAAIVAGRMTVDDLWALVKEKGGDEVDVSRSAVHRYKVREERALSAYQAMQKMSEVWKQERDKDPTGAISMLLGEQVKTITFQRLMSMTPAQIEKADPRDLNFLASTIKSIASADKIGAEREAMIRDRAIKAERRKQEAAMDNAVKKGEIEPELAQRAREIMFGR